MAELPTPTPWEAYSDEFYGRSHVRRIGQSEDEGDVASFCTAEDAALIVKAVNAHDDLMRLLAEISREAKVANDVIRLGRDDECSGRVKVATAMHRIAELAERALARGEA